MFECFAAHTKESANALMNTIRMTFPEASLALVVAMASDKDHIGFAREFLSGILPCIFTYDYLDHKTLRGNSVGQILSLLSNDQQFESLQAIGSLPGC